jgi:hypothetical protein
MRPLNEATATTFASGYYYAEASNAQHLTRFLHTLNANIVIHRPNSVTSRHVTVSVVQPSVLPSGFAVPLGGLAPLLYPLQLALAALTAVLLWYFGVSQSKRIGVMRLGGHSPARIWWTLVGRFVLVVVCGSALASVLSVYILDGGRAG